MNKYEIDEILNMAIMTKTAHVLVEGIDDVSIYEDLSPEDCEVYAIETIEGYTGGCGAVIEAIEFLNNIDAQGILRKYVVGIIDRDAEVFISGEKQMPGLFTLNQYSIESHFVNNEILKKIILQVTNISEKQVQPSINAIDCIDNIDDIYYFSLEALNGATNSSYASIVGYSSKIGRRKDPSTMQQIRSKTDLLNSVANRFGLSRELSSLKLLVKGKWLLLCFSEGLEKLIRSLPEKCKSAEIIQCKVCQFKNTSSCLFKIKDGISNQSIYSLALNIKENHELEYIKSMLHRISQSAKADI